MALSVGIDPSAIAQWKRRGSRPHPSTAVQLADYFDIPVDFLLDDSRSLPDSEQSAPVLEEAQMPYDFLSKPFTAAKALAQREHGPDPEAGQAAFERHLKNLRAMRDLASRENPRDLAAATAHLETLLAAYISALDVPKSQNQTHT